MADDDTWLDSFPVTRTDYPLPFDHGLQAKPAYWGIVDPDEVAGIRTDVSRFQPRRAPEYAHADCDGDERQRGDGVGNADHRVQADATLGAVVHAGCDCSERVPDFAGDLPAGGTASVKFKISLTANCNPNAQWTITALWTANTYETGTFTMTTNFNRGK